MSSQPFLQYMESIPTQYLGPAEVVAVDEASGALEVQLPSRPSSGHLAQVQAPQSTAWALPTGTRVRVGDTLVVAGDTDTLFAIAVVKQDPGRELASRSGASLEIAGDTDELLPVYSPTRELLFEYDPKRQRARLCVAEGDLELSTQNGDIVLDSAQDIRLRGRGVDISGEHQVGLRVGASGDPERAAISLRRQRLQLQSPQLQVTSARSSVHSKEIRFIGGSFEATFERFRVKAERISWLANTWVENARNAYRDIEELCQSRVGRMRTLVDKTYLVSSKRILFRSESDYKVQAEKIHLG
jgi:hypothetical protein